VSRRSPDGPVRPLPGSCSCPAMPTRVLGWLCDDGTRFRSSALAPASQPKRGCDRGRVLRYSGSNRCSQGRLRGTRVCGCRVHSRCAHTRGLTPRRITLLVRDASKIDISYDAIRPFIVRQAAQSGDWPSSVLAARSGAVGSVVLRAEKEATPFTSAPLGELARDARSLGERGRLVVRAFRRLGVGFGLLVVEELAGDHPPQLRLPGHRTDPRPCSRNPRDDLHQASQRHHQTPGQPGHLRLRRDDRRRRATRLPQGHPTRRHSKPGSRAKRRSRPHCPPERQGSRPLGKGREPLDVGSIGDVMVGAGRTRTSDLLGAIQHRRPPVRA